VRRAEEGGAQPLSAQALGANANRRQRQGSPRRPTSGEWVAGCWRLRGQPPEWEWVAGGCGDCGWGQGAKGSGQRREGGGGRWYAAGELVIPCGGLRKFSARTATLYITYVGFAALLPAARRVSCEGPSPPTSTMRARWSKLDVPRPSRCSKNLKD
jgi:hypothetical protein